MTTFDAKFQSNVKDMQVIIAQAQGLGGDGGGGGPRGPRDRNVFDPRDFKLHDLGEKPQLGPFKKWRHELELFVETIGPTWKGVSALLTQSRNLEVEFDKGALTKVCELVTSHLGSTPINPNFFDFEDKADTL